MFNQPLLSFIPWLVVAVIIGCTHHAQATHVRAGEITAVRISNSTLKYRFTLTGYRDTDSPILFGRGSVDFGDGVVLKDLLKDKPSIVVTKQDLGDKVEKVTISFVHTYSSPGKYIVRYNEDNRNAAINNISNSVNTPFFVQSELLIDAFFGLNNTPIFSVAPIDRGAVGVKFLHNPGAFDRDGDSLAYRLVTPKQRHNQKVNNYRLPNAAEFYSNPQRGNEAKNAPPVFAIDPKTGQLTWDAPGKPGEYNIAFVVEEWRKILGKWHLLGSVVRDMQIIIEDSNNKRPKVAPPPDLCVEAGKLVEQTINGTDPDGHPVKLEAFGGPFKVSGSRAVYWPSPARFRSSPTNILFRWQTDCNLVRKRPYEVQLKATDLPVRGPKLVDFKTWRIAIVAPAPEGMAASKAGTRAISIRWNPYTCGKANNLQVWRRVGSYNFTPSSCDVGMPKNAGYTLIDTLDNTYRKGGTQQHTTSYTDNNKGKGLAAGAKYCYRLVATFPEPTGGESYVSKEICLEKALFAPVLLKASIDSTHLKAGKVSLQWQEAQSKTPLPRPFAYDVIRYEGTSGFSNPQTIATRQTDTVYTDTGLNTFSKSYHYLIKAYDALGKPTGQSAAGSTVRLQLTSSQKSITLNWKATVPWSNRVQGKKYHHEIYRGTADTNGKVTFTLIKALDATTQGLSYIDQGDPGRPLLLSKAYYYKVLVRGSYGNPKIKTDPLHNWSQINSAELNDGVPPNCSPVFKQVQNPAQAFDCKTFLADKSCSFKDFFREITWDYDYNTCDKDVKSFRIYFSPDGSEQGYGRQGINYIAEVIGEGRYKHTELSSFKGCYRLAAVDQGNNEGKWSAPMCVDNCPSYTLPNVFTPNGDLINDTFSAYSDVVNGQTISDFDYANCPRFVKSVIFTVFNRVGSVLFNYDSDQKSSQGEPNDILINWNGKTNQGKTLEPGVYYYGADITFDVLKPENRKKFLKGWIQILK